MDVSVIITSYNKGPYIKDCLLGVLNQDFDGEIEIIVADDCSNDKTLDEINLLKVNPNFTKIKYIRHAKNKGLMGNFIWALNQAKGKYLAFCDADDYWTDNNKLTFQVNIMSANTNCIMLGSLMEFKDLRNQNVLTHNAKYIVDLSDGILEKEIFYDLHKVPFHISSLICINSSSIKRKLEKFRFISVSNDIVFWCLLSDIGDCYFSQKIVGIENHVLNGITQIQNHLSLNYRINKLIMWKTLSKELKDKTLKNLANSNYENIYSDSMHRVMNSNLKMMMSLLNNKEYPTGTRLLIMRSWLVMKLSRRLFTISK